MSTTKQTEPRALVAALLAALVLLTALPASAATGTTEGSAGPASWPVEVVAPPDRTATVEDSPPGPAAMAFTFGTQDGPQPGATPFVLAAREDVYRRVEEAQDRSVDADLGAPAPMLLSPDGKTLAVGASRGNGTIALIDLESGTRREVSMSAVTAGTPIAFDLDNGWLWVRARAIAEGQGATVFDDWEWQRVDLAEGTAVRARELDRAMDLAVVPGGATVLVKASQSQAHLYSTDDLTQTGDALPISGDLQPGGVSPDGSRVATGTDGTVLVHSLTDPDAAREEVEVDGDVLVHRWVDDQTLLVSTTGDDGTWQLQTLALDGTTTDVTRLAAEEGRTLQEVSVATGLVDEVVTREAADPDTGSAGWLRWALIAAGVALIAAVGLLVRRRR